MSSDATQIAGSPIEYTFGDITLKYAPIKFGDLADFESWAMGRKIKTTLAAMSELTPTDRAQITKQIIDEGVEIARELTSMAGIIHLLSMSASKYQSEIDDTFIGNMVGIESMVELNGLIDLLMGTSAKNAQKTAKVKK